MARLFFALWPDAPTRQHLAALARTLHGTCGGRIVPAERLHLTLAFLGEVAEARLPELCALAERVNGYAGPLQLDRLGRWRDLVWVGCLEPPAQLMQLAATLRQQLGAAGFAVDEQTFSPHLTLLRKAGRTPLSALDAPIVWPVTDWHLICSQLLPTGAEYRRLAHWPLATAPILAPLVDARPQQTP